LGIAAAGLACTVAHETPVVDAGAEAAAVRHLYGRAVQAAIQKDWPAYEILWAQDASIELLHPDEAEWLVGWTEIKPRMREMFDPDMHLEVESDSMFVRIGPSGDVAWASQELRLRVVTAGETEEFRQWSTLVFLKLDEGWKMVHAQASLVPFKEP
jgi:hypothetical protein